jgi:hypothetical protein
VRRWRAILVVPCAFGLFLGAGLLRSWMVSVEPVVVATVGVLGFVGIMFCWFQLVFSKCPACGKLFFIRGFYGNVFSRRCLHCRFDARRSK